MCFGMLSNVTREVISFYFIFLLLCGLMYSAQLIQINHCRVLHFMKENHVITFLNIIGLAEYLVSSKD